MAEVIKEIDWNGHHYTFTNTFKSTGTKSHDILTMTDENGNSVIGETTWINRPWHRFDLEEAFTEIVEKAFGKKALKLITDINEKAHSVEDAIGTFFSKFKPEDIEFEEKVEADASEENRKASLAKYLEVDADDLESISKNEFEVNGETYLVLTDEEADNEYYEYIKNLWYDLGAKGIVDYLGDWIIDNIIDTEALADAARADIADYIYDMADEEVADECISEGICEPADVYDEESDVMQPDFREDVDFDDLREQLIDSRIAEVEDDPVEYFRNLGFDDSFFEDYIDEDEAIDAIRDAIDVNGEGRGSLSYYDGAEHDLNDGFFAYRID